jgi:diguanylate cyclase (GGDEF)-like protein/PAS domain S-box-containing protein
MGQPATCAKRDSGPPAGGIKSWWKTMRLESSAHRADVTLDAISDGVLTTDVAGNVTYLNLAAEAMTGWSREVAVGRPLGQIFHIIDRESREVARDPLRLAVQLNRTVGLTPHCLLVRKDGEETAIEDSAAPIRDDQGTVTGAVIVFRNVGVTLEMSRQMAYLAQHDMLTGLPNRLLLDDRLTEAIALARRRGTPLAVCFLDIDGFKGVNDRLGHAAGDSILQSVAAGLCGVLRRSDTVSRYGGDEFVILLPEIKRAADAGGVAKKLLLAAAGPHRVAAEDVAVTGSLGAAIYPGHGEDGAVLVRNSDAAMYEAKHSGLGSFRIFESGMMRSPSVLTTPSTSV